MNWSWLSFIVGILVGWLLEWLIDFIFWRRKHRSQQSAARLVDLLRLSPDGRLLTLVCHATHLVRHEGNPRSPRAERILHKFDRRGGHTEGGKHHNRRAPLSVIPHGKAVVKPGVGREED